MKGFQHKFREDIDAQEHAQAVLSRTTQWKTLGIVEHPGIEAVSPAGSLLAQKTITIRSHLPLGLINRLAHLFFTRRVLENGHLG